MPRRPRSHQLEDLSLNRFREIVPPAWVVRERSRDYGVDLEVEVFADDGEATGLIFYVQLRATDDRRRATKLRFAIDQLEYFRSLDLPVAIVRYSAADQSLHLMWDFETPATGRDSASQTLTFTSDQRWTSETPGRIFSTLETLRLLKLRSESPLSVELVTEGADMERSYAVQRSFERLRTLGFIGAGHASRPLTLQVRSTSSKLVIGIDRIAEVEVDESGSDFNDPTAALAWSAVRLLWQLGLKPAANRLARRVVAAGHRAPTPSLALTGALSLLPDAAAAIEVACQAGIHRRQDEGFLVLTAAIHSRCLPETDVGSRTALFREALNHANQNQDATTRAALHYSMANAFRGARKFAEAVMHYNRALKLRPTYAEAPYFWAELGGCLYLRRKYRSAARAYELALALEVDPRLAILTADAQLGAGEPGRAAELYDRAEQMASAGSPGEAALKAEFSRKIAQTYGVRFSRPTRTLGPLWETAAVDGRWAAVLSVDPLDPLANFNDGKALADAGAPGEAFWRFLAVALIQPGDEEAWCNTLICAFATDAVRMATALHLALFHCGRAPYDLVRAQLLERGGLEVLPDLDAIVTDVLTSKETDQSLTIRLFDGQAFRHAFKVTAT